MLSPRLQKVADMLLPPETRKPPMVVCDIGTDHAKIPIYLIKHGVKHVIATDIKHGPAFIARENIREAGLGFEIDIRVGGGFAPIGKNEVEAAIIAGIGGITTCDILFEGVPEGIETFVLQPMTAKHKLRRFLARNGFVIVREELVAEGDKLYNILLVKRGVELFADEVSILIGRKLIQDKHPLLELHLKREIDKLESKIKWRGEQKHIDILKQVKELLE